MHDSLQRHQQSQSMTGNEAPWDIAGGAAQPARARMFSRRAWLLLVGLVFFSLGSWGAVTLWPALLPYSNTPDRPDIVREAMRPGGADVRQAGQGVPDGQAASAGDLRTQNQAGRSESDSQAVAHDAGSQAVPGGSAFQGQTRPGAAYAVQVNADQPAADLAAGQRPETETLKPATAPLDAGLVMDASDGSDGDAGMDLDSRAVHELNNRLDSLLAMLRQSTVDPARSQGEEGGHTDSAASGTSFGSSTADTDISPGDVSQGSVPGLEQGISHPGEQAGNGGAGSVEGEADVRISVQARAQGPGLSRVRQLEKDLGRALRGQKWAEFDMALQTLASIRPQDEEGLAQWRAARAMAMADYDQAGKILTMLHRAKPHDPHAGINLALVYEAQGRLDSARDLARRLARSHPLNADVQSLLDRLENQRQ